MNGEAGQQNPALPEPVGRYLELAWPEERRPLETLELTGRGRVRIGALPWLPIDMRMYHRLGHDYVGLIRVRLGGITVLPVIDAYVDGAGITKIGPVGSIGPEIDQGAFLGMWAAAIAYPETWQHVAWQPIDEESARARIAFREGAEETVVRFNPATGYPVRFEAERFKGTTGRKVRWYADSYDWRLVAGVPVPGRVTARWADEAGPWFDLSVSGARARVSIDEALVRGRRAINAAREGQRRASRSRL